MVAGGGQLTRGSTLLGLGLMLPFLTAVVALLAIAGFIPSPRGPATGLTTFHTIVAGTVAAVTYAVALWEGAREP
jgi:hypothetical protein